MRYPGYRTRVCARRFPRSGSLNSIHLRLEFYRGIGLRECPTPHSTHRDLNHRSTVCSYVSHSCDRNAKYDVIIIFQRFKDDFKAPGLCIY